MIKKFFLEKLLTQLLQFQPSDRQPGVRFATAARGQKKTELRWQSVLGHIWSLLHSSYCCHKPTIASLPRLT